MQEHLLHVCLCREVRQLWGTDPRVFLDQPLKAREKGRVLHEDQLQLGSLLYLWVEDLEIENSRRDALGP